jgi:hypothetical protein
MTPIKNRIPIVVNPDVFAVCRDCLVPMLGIRDANLRDFCVDHTQEEAPEVDLTKCKGI